MSVQAVRLFYQKLEKDNTLRARAMMLKERYSDQDELIGAFLALAEEAGYSFNAQELAAYIYENGTEECK